MRGYLYILTNRAFPGVLKIGYTDRDPNARVAELNNTSVPHPFEIAFEALVDRPQELERLVHREIENTRENAQREFFRIRVSDAVEAVNRVCEAAEIKVIHSVDLERAQRLRQHQANEEAKKRASMEGLIRQEKLMVTLSESKIKALQVEIKKHEDFDNIGGLTPSLLGWLFIVILTLLMGQLFGIRSAGALILVGFGYFVIFSFVVGFFDLWIRYNSYISGASFKAKSEEFKVRMMVLEEEKQSHESSLRSRQKVLEHYVSAQNRSS